MKELVFEKRTGNSLVEINTVTKEYNKKKPLSTEITPTQASLKKCEGYIYQNVSSKKQIKGPNYEQRDLVRTVDKKNNFS